MLNDVLLLAKSAFSRQRNFSPYLYPVDIRINYSLELYAACMPIGLVGVFSINDTNFRRRGNCSRRSARRVKLRTRKARSQKTALSRGFFGVAWRGALLFSTPLFVPLDDIPFTHTRAFTNNETKRGGRLAMVPFPRHDFEILPDP